MSLSKGTDILLVGKTGNGKSATANSIVGYKAFRSRPSMQSVTTSAQFEYGEFEGRVLKVVDGPGIGDTRLNTEDAVKLVIKAMNFAVAANPCGYHAILLVTRFGTRFTEEDIQCIKLLKDIFGEDFIRYHGILVLTHGDNFLKEQEETGETFEQWIRCQGGFTEGLIKECGERVILFNNKTKDKYENAKQVGELLKIIDCLAGSGIRYTSEIFERGKAARDNLLRKSKKKLLSEETLIECGLITEQLSRIDFENPENEVDKLEKLRRKADILEQNIKKEDEGTNSLQVALTLAKQLKDSVDEQEKAVMKVLKHKMRTKEMELEREMEKARLDADEARRREEERKRQEDVRKWEARETERQREYEKQKEEHKKMMREMDEKAKKSVENVHSAYDNVKQEQSYTWGEVAGALAQPVADLVKWWFKK